MIVMLDTSHDLAQAEAELGCPVEELFTPLTRRSPKRPDSFFAIDNGAFSKKGFDAKAFRNLLERHKSRIDLCRFVVVPDVVGSARRTLEVFEHWRHQLPRWKLAFVAQDGQEDLPIPFQHIDCLFIGGSTRWKESDAAIQCVRAARACEKHVHIGRINDSARFEGFDRIGADSCDGTGIAQYTWMRELIRERNGENRLFPTSEMVNVSA